jgi:hypothetical protein
MHADVSRHNDKHIMARAANSLLVPVDECLIVLLRWIDPAHDSPLD